MIRFSYSSLETYKKCPAQFKIRYIDDIRKSDESVEAFMGKRVHESLEYLYNEVLDGRIPFFDHVIEKYNSYWQDKWHNRIGIVRVKNTTNYYKYLGEDCIARYFRKHSPFKESIVGNEIELNFILDANSEYQIKGIVDRLDHDGEGNWEIHDYKSGKRALTQIQADKDNQLALYQIGLINKDKEIKSVKLVWHFLQQGIEVESVRTEKQLKDLSISIKKQIDNIRSKMDSGGEFPAKESTLCNWCYYWEECPAQNGTNPFIK
ncbi:PD-(D/E)XK nuclease family protein [bacterium]|nr:PD-(D/E)XK nuclease family protein [bacterium]